MRGMILSTSTSKLVVVSMTVLESCFTDEIISVGTEFDGVSSMISDETCDAVCGGA